MQTSISHAITTLAYCRGQELSVGVLCECKRSAVVAQLTITMVPYGTERTALKSALPIGRSQRHSTMVPWAHPSHPILIGSAVFSHHSRLLLYFTISRHIFPSKLPLLLGDLHPQYIAPWVHPSEHLNS